MMQGRPSRLNLPALQQIAMEEARKIVRDLIEEVGVEEFRKMIGDGEWPR
jgi:hypothetical protein